MAALMLNRYSTPVDAAITLLPVKKDIVSKGDAETGLVYQPHFLYAAIPGVPYPNEDQSQQMLR
jgi:hypothetical protein